MNPNYEPGYDPEVCAEPDDLPCRYCGQLVTDEDMLLSGDEEAHEACIEDNYDGPDDVDYDAPSMSERLEMDHRVKERLR